MDPERWERVKELFGRILASPPERREEELASASEEPDVVAQVRRLLAAAERGAGEVFEQGALAAAPELREAWQTAVPGHSIGPYRLVAELGRGGMGAVYLGVREGADFNQRVAIKLIKRGMDTEEIVRRFLRERRILAGLSHPNIARLLDGGATEDGRPYFILEHVEGQPITTWARERGLDVEARLRLFLKVCAAVQVAHQSLIVHRDLKPANVLVGADGEPKLLDFGIAKLLEPGDERQGGDATALTGRETPRTPEYASPEQLAGRPMTTAVDVYGLGILLFELLTGLAPGAAARRLGPGWDGRLPSQVVRALDPQDAGSHRRARRLRGDLDAIVRKALEPEPHRRYGTAAALAEDVERHLAQQPIAARRPTPLYRLGRTLARHKLASAAVLGLLLLAATASYQAFELTRQHRRVEGERRRALALAEFLQGLFRSADPDQNRGAVLTAREVLSVGSRRLLDEPGARPRWWAAGDTAPALEPRTRADLLQAVGEVYASLGLYPEARRLMTQALDLRAAPVDRTDRGDRDEREKIELERAETLSQLGEVALLASDYPAARRFYQEALARKRRLLGPRALPLARDWNGLGLLADDPAAAEPCFRWALTIARSAGAPGREALASSLNNLGKLALDRDDFAAARQRFSATLALRREVLGDDHPDTVQARSNLASALFRLGQYDRAEALYQEIVTIRRHLLGPDHPVLALTLSSLAVVQQQLGRLAAAEASLREALAMRRRLGLAPDEGEADILNGLAAVLRKQEHLDEAERIYQESFALYGRLLGAGHLRQANVLNGLARVQRQRADLPGAERLARQALSLQQQRSETPATALADTWALLGEILAAEARTAESAAAWRQCLELRSRSLPPDHPALAEARRALDDLPPGL